MPLWLDVTQLKIRSMLCTCLGLGIEVDFVFTLCLVGYYFQIISIKIHKKDNIEEKFNKANFDNIITVSWDDRGDKVT